MGKCNRDCFHCKYDDCIVTGISSKERKEIKERDTKFIDGDGRNSSIVFARVSRNRKRRAWGF